MAQKLYVGNLSYSAKDEDLRNLFSQYGTVQSATVISDKFSGRSKGFGFVEMSTPDEAQKAIELNGKDFMGRPLTVSEARPQEPRQDRGGSGGGFRGGKGGGGGGGRRF